MTSSHASDTSIARAQHRLFAVSFLVLFLELACIRWFASAVIFLTFFTNIVLIACFLGLSTGLLTASKPRDYLRTVLPILFATMTLAALVLLLYENYNSITIDVGTQSSPQQIFFGTEYRPKDPSQIVIPLELIAGTFFVLIALVFLGLGQTMGRAFNQIPNRIRAYTLDISGSISGIVAFALASYFQAPPLFWFGLCIAVCLYLIFSTHDKNSAPQKLAKHNMLGQIISACGIVFVAVTTGAPRAGQELDWSPYYKIDYHHKTRDIYTNNIGHQAMQAIGKTGSAYMLPHLLKRQSLTGQSAPVFDDVLIIGAGSGNDVAAALRAGAKHIDAVEIDPVINQLGRRFHPDRPYDDPRVTVHLDDGRSFLKKTRKKYDLVIYALVDSLVLHSSYSSLRLESFLFTRQAFEDVRARLKPGGVFAMYNFYRQGWVVARLATLADQVFGSPPIVLSLPYAPEIETQSKQFDRFTCILAGDTSAFKAAFARRQFFWLHDVPSIGEKTFSFGPNPPNDDPSWRRIGPARIVDNGGAAHAASLLPADDWPFLYLQQRVIPWLNLRGMLMIAVLSLGMLWVFAPRAATLASGIKTPRFNAQMFFLGAGFMLLETKSVVHMALLFGSTWLVNSIVFGAVLLMILAANLWVQKIRVERLTGYYVCLFIALLIGVLVPLNTFLALPDAVKIPASCAITFGPIFFAGVVFARVFRDSENPDIDFGSNVGGVILGGLCEYFSLVIGFNNLLALAMAFYFLSAIFGTRKVEDSTHPAPPAA